MKLMNWRRFCTLFLCASFPLCFLFSATWPDGVRRLAKSYLKNPMIVYVGTLDLAVSCSVSELGFFGGFFFFGEEPTVKPGNILLVNICK